MNYYGKKMIDHTPEEKTLFNKDMVLKTSMNMNINGERLLGMGANHLGTQEDVDNRFVDRYITAGKILGLEVPKTQDEFDTLVNVVDSTDYGFFKFLDECEQNMLSQVSN